jgi:DNA-binding response OmpR family regulator
MRTFRQESAMAKIAVIEDEVATNDDYRKLLETLPGVQVVQAHTYEEAITVIRDGDLDLLLVDIDLGGAVKGQLRGFDLLREFGQQTAVIIVTGMPEQNLHAMALQLKAYDFIRKPINELDLLNKVQHALEFSSNTNGRHADVWPKGLEREPSRPPHVTWKKRPVNLTLTELTIVHCLADRAGDTIAHEKLAAAMKSGNSPRALAQHIAGVRKKFMDVDPEFDCIETDPGSGYRWKIGE